MPQRRSHRGHGGPPDILARKPPVSESDAMALVRALPLRDQRNENDKATRDLVEGLMQDAYDIALKFSHQWFEDAADCCGVAYLALVEAVKAIEPARIEHGRQVFAIMQTTIDNALTDYIKKGRQFQHGKPTPKTLTNLGWGAPDEHRNSIRKQPQCETPQHLQTANEQVGAQLRQLFAPRSELEIVAEILESVTDAERPLAEQLINMFLKHGNNVSAVARDMGVDRRTVRRLRNSLHERYYDSPKQRILRILSDD